MAALDILLLVDYHGEKNLKTWACRLFFCRHYPVLRKSTPHNSICNNYLAVNCSSNLVSRTLTSVDTFQNQSQALIWIIISPKNNMITSILFSIVEEISTMFKLTNNKINIKTPS